MNLNEVISVVTLKRTDTTLDLSQKAKRFGFLKNKSKEKTGKTRKKEEQKLRQNMYRECQRNGSKHIFILRSLTTSLLLY